MPGLDFLVLVLQRYNRFNLIAFFFKFCLVCFLCLQGPYSVVVFMGRVLHGVVCSRLKLYIVFFRWNLQMGFSRKSCFRKVLHFLYLVCNDEALNLRLHVVALLASVTMSWPAKTTEKLNKSGLDCLALVLQTVLIWRAFKFCLI